MTLVVSISYFLFIWSISIFFRVSSYIFCFSNLETAYLLELSPSRMFIWLFLYSFFKFSSKDLMYLFNRSISLSSSSTMNFILFFSLSSFSFSLTSLLSAFLKSLSAATKSWLILSLYFRSLSFSSSYYFLSFFIFWSISLRSSSNFCLASWSYSYSFFIYVFLTSLADVSLAICWVIKEMFVWYSELRLSFSTSILWKLSWRSLSSPVLRSPDSLIRSRRPVILCSLYLILSWSSWRFLS